MAELLLHVEKLKALGVESARLLGCVTLAAITAAPFSAEKTIETTIVDTSFLSAPLQLSFRPDETQLDVLNLASFYAPMSFAGIGVKGELQGLPRITTKEQLGNLISPERFSFYSSLADSPGQATDSYEIALKQEARDNFLTYELVAGGIGGIALYGGFAYRRLRNERDTLLGRPTFPLQRKSVVAAAVAATLMSGAAAYASHEQWQSENAVPTENTAVIKALDGTSLEGTIIDNPLLLDGVNDAISYAKLQRERRIAQREEYIAKTTAELRHDIETLDPPRENETFFLVISDVHASKAGIEILKQFVIDYRAKFGDESLKLVFNLGDMSQGLAVQRAAILELGRIIPGGIMVTTFGNHDLDPTKEAAHDAGMQTSTGFQEYEGISVYNTEDPAQTPFLGMSTTTTVDQTELGEQVRSALDTRRATVANFHEPAALAAFLGVGTGELIDYLDSEHSLTSCGPDHLHNIPTGLASAGHWHDSYPLQIACNDDGTWSVIDIVGTAGGANEASTFNSWSDPDGKPIKTLAWRGFYLNETYDSITGALDFSIDTEGHIAPLQRTDIGTYDGSPFNMQVRAASGKHKR